MRQAAFSRVPHGKAEPATAKARAAHTPPIDIIGGRRPTPYSDGTPSDFEGAASEAEPAAAKARAAHTPPIDIIGGRRPTPYSDGTPSVFEGAADGAPSAGFSPFPLCKG